jgi:hypothetical protein
MWQGQLISIVEGNSLDSDHIADLLITYEAETGDPSLRGCGVEVLMFMGALRPWPRSGSGSVSEFLSRSGSGSLSRSGSGSKSWSVFGSLSGSRSWYKSRSRSGSKSWSVFGSLFGSRSWYKSRSRSGSK